MSRPNRLFDIMQLLRGGALFRAEDIATQMGVSVRTIYRDMDTLMASGAPVSGERGVGYSASATTTLPPLHLSDAEIEALNLGLAIVAQSGDLDLRTAAQSLGTKVDNALPTQSIPDSQTWAHATYPFADAARGFSHMPTIRAAIRAKQKLRITYHSKGDRISSRIIRPLLLDHWARIWTLSAWCEARSDFRAFRVDLIQSAEALPQMFVDEPGKVLSDWIR